MTATDELRRMLDERGVEWRERVWGGKHSVVTFWRARGVRWHYRENRFGEIRLHADGLPPAQAIAATLGDADATAERRDGAGTVPHRTTTRHGKWRTKYGRSVPCCECCGYGIGDARWHYCPSCGAEVVE